MTINSNEFSQIYTLFYKEVYYFVLFKIKNEEEARDIASEVFLYAFKTWDKLPGDEAETKKWLIITAKSRVIDFFRKSHTNFSINSLRMNMGSEDETDIFANLVSSEPLPEDYFTESEYKKEALDLLNLVDESDKQILISKYIQDLTFKEIAEIYDIKEGTARKRVERALNKIKEQVDKNKI